MSAAKTSAVPRAAHQFDAARLLQGAESATQILMACKNAPEVLLQGMRYGQDDSTEYDFEKPRGELERRIAAAFDKNASADYREGFLRALSAYLTTTAKGAVPTIDAALAGQMLDEYAGAITGTPLPQEPPEPPAPDFAEDRAAVVTTAESPPRAKTGRTGSKQLDAKTFGQIECLLGDIAALANAIDSECSYEHADADEAELRLGRMRSAFLRVGWLADLASLKIGGGFVVRADSEATAAADWMLSPLYRGYCATGGAS